MKPRAEPIPRKVLAIVVVVILLFSGAFAAWFFYFRHWSIREVGDQVIEDPDLSSPGFKHGLAGKSVVVEGKITNLTTRVTTLGTMTFVELDRFELMQLVVWGPQELSIGKRFEMKVEFEWSVCNDETHVYSPQLWFPNFFSLPSIETVLRAVNFVADGAGLETTQLSNGDVRVLVNYVSNPIPLGLANSSIKAGHHSWTGEYIEIMGEPTYDDNIDFIPNLGEDGNGSGIIHFTDANLDRYLDEGDYFILRNLTIPDTASGFKTYIFRIGWPRDPDWNVMTNGGFAMSYLPMTSRGLLRYNDTETTGARIVRDQIPSGFEVTIKRIEGYRLDWSNVTAQLSVGYNFAKWTLSSLDLVGASGATWTYPEVAIGGYSVVLKIRDAQGDGVMDEGDVISVVSEGSPFSNDTSASLTLISDLTFASICMSEFPMNQTPTSRVAYANSSTGVDITFGPPHTGTNNSYEKFDVAWQDLVVAIGDGNNTASWSLNSDVLEAGEGGTAHLAPTPLGSIMVTCNVSDLQGNGYLNGYDSLTIEPIGGTKFSESLTYTVRLIYVQSSSDLAIVSFTG